MKKVLILRYGEIHLKGNNRGFFEKLLINNIKKVIKPFGCSFFKINGRYVIDNFENEQEQALINKVQKVFGLVSLSVAIEVETDENLIKTNVKSYVLNHFSMLNLQNKTFRVSVNRADKNFPINSDVFAGELGGLVLECYPNLKVKLKNSDIILSVDIRENGKTYIYSDVIHCNGGMPVGCAGRCLLMLSGGIDSPVAGYQMAKRGMSINAVHFHSYPYTSEQAKDKVITLATKLTEYAGNIRLYCVKFTKIQEEIHANCDNSYMINIMRRIMLRIAERICIENNYKAIVTGESLGQVASQTIESITSTNSVVKQIPILRPLISNDKEETIKIANKIGTFETSILPFEDCCTVFLPPNPVIKPQIYKVLRQESFLNIDKLIDDAMRDIEIIDL